MKDDTYKEGDENEGGYNIAGELVIDKRRLWNLPGYNYRGFGNTDTGKGQEITYKQGGANVTRVLLQEKSMYKTPWVYQNKFAMPEVEGLDQTVENAYNPGTDAGQDDFIYEPNVMCAVRNAGKWRRETIYEKQMSAKNLYTTINFPILRYSDVLLMFAEAVNECPDIQGLYLARAKEEFMKVRERAGIETDQTQLDDPQAFRELLRNERGRELAFEGLRKYDLIRWGIFVDKMRQAGNNIPRDNDGYYNKTYTNFAAISYGNVSERHIYLPIPTKELAVNHALTQNPLW